LPPLEKLAELNPNTPEYRVLLGQAKQTIGDLEGAADAYRTVLTERPGDMDALQGLTGLLLQQGRPQAAIGLLQDTLQSAPQTNEVTPGAIDVGSVQLLLAQVYVEEDKVDDALRIYDDAIAADPEDFRLLLAKALVLREADRAPDAVVLFKQAEELAPAQYKDQVRELAQGNSAAAAPALEEESSLTPDLVPEADTEPTAAPNDDSSAEDEEFID
jgi:tetratricopeptide (TPR) repeat protein